MACNNCGNLHHSYRYCKIPITSNGIIHVTSDHKFLMIRRRNTLGFVDFIRGRYSLGNEAHIQNLIDEMTLDEKSMLLTKTFPELCTILWNYPHEDSGAREKFETLKPSIPSLVEKSKTAWTSQEWGFPKGRRNNNETDMMSALREYEEETGYDRRGIRLLKNILPYEEIFTGSNFKSYKHKYFVGFSDAAPSRPHQESEVSAVELLSYEDALVKIRPYNVERKRVLTQVHHLLSMYFPFKNA
jgi:8-oxo-dGTP pyrophosphatase MutT (NUDIX family)